MTAGQDQLDQDLVWPVVAAKTAAAKLGENTVVLEVGPVLAITDFFVITSGANARQVRTIIEEIEERVAAAGGPKPIRIEGRDDFTWVLMDYGDFVVHVFQRETREYYDLERLWGDVRWIAWEEAVAGVR